MAYNFLQFFCLVTDATISFIDNRLSGIEARQDNTKAAPGRSLMLMTPLDGKLGYDAGAKIARTAHKNATTRREEAVDSGPIRGASRVSRDK